MKPIVFALLILFAAISAMAQNRTVNASWNDDLNGPTARYIVYRAPGDCTGTPAFEPITPAPIAAKTFDDAIIPGHYCYMAKTVVSAIESDPSNLAPITVQPFPVTQFKVTLTMTGTLTVEPVAPQE